MKEKIFEKKLQALKELGVKYKWTFHISEEGNYYIKNSYQRTITYDYYNVTKNLINRLGTEKIVPSYHEIIMLTKTGKFLQKNRRSVGFKPLNRTEYPDLWHIGRKSEWVLDKSVSFICCKLATQFSSFKEFKNFLGFEFVNEQDFNNLCSNGLQLVIFYKNRTQEERVNLMQLVKVVSNSDILDVIRMSRELNIEVIIPAGKNSFRELHDYLSFEQNKLNSPLLEVKVEIENFNIPYTYEVVTTNVRLKERGEINRHCIGGYGRKMLKDLFLVIGDSWDCHITKSDVWQISQIRGFANSEAPKDMVDIVNLALKRAEIKIKNCTPSAEAMFTN